MFDFKIKQIASGVEKVEGFLKTLGGQRVALCLQDRFLFSAALVACWKLDKQVVLLPHHGSGTLTQFQNEFDHVLMDKDLAPLSFSDSNREIGFSISRDAKITVFTSGSQGIPARHQKRFENLYREVEILEQYFGSTMGQDLVLTTVSHHHIYGFLFSVLWPLLCSRPIGADVVRYPEELPQASRNHQSWNLVSSPAFLKRYFLDQKEPHPCRQVFSSGGKLDFEAAILTKKYFGSLPVEVYGSTETGGIAYRRQTLANAPWIPFESVKINVLPEGRFTVKSPYFDEQAIEMEDRVLAHDDGTFQLLGRADDIVKVEEKRVSLIELNDRLRKSGMIEDVATVALEEKGRQLIGCVAVLSNRGKKCLAEEGKASICKQLKDELTRTFDPLVVPRKFRFVSGLPYNAQSKLTQSSLKAFFMDEVQMEVSFPVETGFFKGHFPDLPLLPGVMQLHFAISKFEEQFDQKFQFSGIQWLKFFNPIFPGKTVKLEIKRNSEKNLMAFRYFDDQQEFSKGLISYSKGVK